MFDKIKGVLGVSKASRNVEDKTSQYDWLSSKEKMDEIDEFLFGCVEKYAERGEPFKEEIIKLEDGSTARVSVVTVKGEEGTFVFIERDNKNDQQIQDYQTLYTVFCFQDGDMLRLRCVQEHDTEKMQGSTNGARKYAPTTQEDFSVLQPEVLKGDKFVELSSARSKNITLATIIRYRTIRSEVAGEFDKIKPDSQMQ